MFKLLRFIVYIYFILFFIVIISLSGTLIRFKFGVGEFDTISSLERFAVTDMIQN